MIIESKGRIWENHVTPSVRRSSSCLDTRHLWSPEGLENLVGAAAALDALIAVVDPPPLLVPQATAPAWIALACLPNSWDLG